MIKEIIKFPNPYLSKKAVNVKNVHSPETKIVIRNLTDTIIDNPSAAGLSANQIGSNLNIFIFRVVLKDKSDGFSVIINPRIISKSRNIQPSIEGCLSIPNITRKLARPISLFLMWQDVNGARNRGSVEGYIATVFLHEVDHLQGKTILDVPLYDIWYLEEKAKAETRRNEVL
jgi:peptide deformylase